ncbi:MAG: SHOCT domain-containing protein [Actinobacteria bacterium]|nr:SHOCT domain-containing protein [Actinomycetota bacterium]
MLSSLYRIALATVLAAVAVPAIALAHTGGALDADGCHTDHRNSTYHCHRGEAGGYTFADRAAMQDAVRTGKFPDKTVEKEGFFSKLWPFGKDEEEEAGGEGSTPAAGAAVPGSQRDAEQRLKTLQGLYEMGLLSREEYEAKRKEVLGQL